MKIRILILITIILLAFIFAIVSFIYGPSIDPPTYFKSDDPYWYSGN